MAHVSQLRIQPVHDNVLDLGHQIRQVKRLISDEVWLDQFGELYRQNGYLSRPLDIYKGFLPLITRSGTILDLGCGNGMLLRYILERSGQQLIPFGIDLDARAIETARNVVLREYADNFLVSDIRRHVHVNRPFDIILTNPVFANQGYYDQVGGIIQQLYPDGSIRRYLEHCLMHRAVQGELILYCYEEEYQRIPNFQAVFERETAGYELEHRVSALGRAAYWAIR